MDVALPDTVLIGAGNVGYHLGRRLAGTGVPLKQIFSRSKDNAARLGEAAGCAFTIRLEEIIPDASLYLLAVHDDAIEQVASQLSSILPEDSLVAHTSGGTPYTVLSPYFNRCGVLYPLQTFSTYRDVRFDTIPICIETAQSADLNLLQAVANQISDSVHIIDDQKRAVLHVAGVFVNNFTNHLFRIGQDILEREDLSFDMLRPLILETARKVQDHDPAAMQTGPATRDDRQTIERHLEYLEKFPAYREIYQRLSAGINPELKSEKDH